MSAYSYQDRGDGSYSLFDMAGNFIGTSSSAPTNVGTYDSVGNYFAPQPAQPSRPPIAYGTQYEDGSYYFGPSSPPAAPAPSIQQLAAQMAPQQTIQQAPQMSAREQEIRALYSGLGREADQAGLNWWLNNYSGNNLANDFMAGARGNNEQFNQSAYQAALNSFKSPSQVITQVAGSTTGQPSPIQQAVDALLPASQTGVETVNRDGTYNPIVNNIDYSVRPNLKQFADRTGLSPIEASNLLYGVVGANNDIRDWRAIMSSADPLAAVREANFQMINDPRYATKNPSYNLNPEVSQVLGQSGNLGVYQLANTAGGQTALLSGDGRLLTTVGTNDPAGLLRKLQEFGIPLSQVSGLADIYEKNNINYMPGTMYAGSDAGVDFRKLAQGELGTSYNWLQDKNAALKGPNGQEAVTQANNLANFFGIKQPGLPVNAQANAVQGSLLSTPVAQPYNADLLRSFAQGQAPQEQQAEARAQLMKAIREGDTALLNQIYGDTYDDSLKLLSDLGIDRGSKDAQRILPASPTGYSGAWKFDPVYGSEYYGQFLEGLSDQLGIDKSIARRTAGDAAANLFYNQDPNRVTYIDNPDYLRQLTFNTLKNAGIDPESAKGQAALNAAATAGKQINEGLFSQSNSSGFLGQKIVKPIASGLLDVGGAVLKPFGLEEYAAPAIGAGVGLLTGGTATPLLTPLLAAAAGGATAAALPNFAQGDLEGGIKAGLKGGVTGAVTYGVADGLFTFGKELWNGATGQQAFNTAVQRVKDLGGAAIDQVGNIFNKSGQPIGTVQDVIKSTTGATTADDFVRAGAPFNDVPQAALPGFFDDVARTTTPLTFDRLRDFGFQTPSELDFIEGGKQFNDVPQTSSTPGFRDEFTGGNRPVNPVLTGGVPGAPAPKTSGLLETVKEALPDKAKGLLDLVGTGNPIIDKLLTGLLGTAILDQLTKTGGSKSSGVELVTPKTFTINPRVNRYLGDPSKYGETDIGNFRFYDTGLLG